MIKSHIKGIIIDDNVSSKKSTFGVPDCYKEDLEAVLIPKGLIYDRIKSLAREIHMEIKDQEIVMLCVLKGSFRFFNKLLKEFSLVRLNCKSKILVEFIRLKSYTNTHSCDNVEIIGFSNMNELRDKNVLIIEDMIDSGKTLTQLLKKLKTLEIKKFWTCFLLSKRTIRTIEFEENFVAFSVPDIFVVGYGLDYNEYFRDLNEIYTISKKGIEKYKK